jgi:glycosyltransferase involved in cell wall biosynthesis
MATTLTVHRGTWHRVDRYIALTDRIAEHLREYGIPDERIAIKPNGIPDPGVVAPPGDGFLFAARLSPEKGLALLLDAWRCHPAGALGPLRIAGDGPLRELAETAAAERTDISYLGPLSTSGVLAELGRTGAVIAASTWHDVLPTSILEALAAGRPVLATDLGGMPYLVGDAGWIVPPTVAGMADGLARAAKEAKGLADTARQRYVDNFHPDRLTQRLIEIYEETVQ